MTHLTFTVIEVVDYGSHSVIRVQVSSDTPDITTGDVFNVVTTPDIAALNEVGQPFVGAAQ
jgi:hypothetical protein